MKKLEGEMLGTRIYINTKEAKNERPHVHMSTGRGPRSNDLKVWLMDKRGRLAISTDEMKGSFSNHEMKDGLDTIERNHEYLVKAYLDMHGQPMARKAKSKTNKR